MPLVKSKKIIYTDSDMNMPQRKGPLAHAYLISADSAEARQRFAGQVAQTLVCAEHGERSCNICADCEKAGRGIHPDIMTIAPMEGKREIPVATVREMVAEAPTLPNEAERKVYIVEPADSLNPNAQNAFLKLLEEPPSFVTFLLLAENPLALLPTVRSRCVSLNLTPERADDPELETRVQELVDAFIIALQKGQLDLLQFCVGLEKTERETLRAFIEAAHCTLATALGKEKANRARLLKAVDLLGSLRSDLRFNVSTGHISGKILATLI